MSPRSCRRRSPCPLMKCCVKRHGFFMISPRIKSDSARARRTASGSTGTSTTRVSSSTAPAFLVKTPQRLASESPNSAPSRMNTRTGNCQFWVFSSAVVYWAGHTAARARPGAHRHLFDEGFLVVRASPRSVAALLRRVLDQRELVGIADLRRLMDCFSPCNTARQNQRRYDSSDLVQFYRHRPILQIGSRLCF